MPLSRTILSRAVGSGAAVDFRHPKFDTALLEPNEADFFANLPGQIDPSDGRAEHRLHLNCDLVAHQIEFIDHLTDMHRTKDASRSDLS